MHTGQGVGGDVVAPPAEPMARVDGMWLAEAADVAVDVLFDGRRIWSFNPRRDAKRQAGDGLFRVPWPAPLPPYLDGTAQVTLQEHLSGRVLLDRLTTFGTKQTPVRFEDRDGHPLIVDKTGRAGRSFAERDPELVDRLMSAANDAIAMLNEQGGVTAFLAFGGLLGAVREGKLIGHDVDLDLGYLSGCTSPADVARESFRLERMFTRAGWQTHRMSGDDFKVLAPGVEGMARWIDVFGGFIADGRFYLMPNVVAPPDSVRLLPLGEVELEGHRIPAPADPESLLAATYGPGWRTPDPAFKFETPRPDVRRFDGWMRSAMSYRGYWFPFYSIGPSGDVPRGPSDFATWFAGREAPGARVLDLGCGTGRDSFWLADAGFPVLGLDYAPAAIGKATKAARERNSSARFELLNLYDLRQVLARGGLDSYEPEPPFLYGRFLLHSLEDRARQNLWLLARMTLRRGGRLYLEFRSGSAGDDTVSRFGKHFRRYLSREEVASEIEANGGRVEYHEEGHGMAVLNDEDPYICRMVASWHR